MRLFLCRPLFRYSPWRDGWVLHVVGENHGPVLVRRTDGGEVRRETGDPTAPRGLSRALLKSLAVVAVGGVVVGAASGAGSDSGRPGTSTLTAEASTADGAPVAPAAGTVTASSLPPGGAPGGRLLPLGEEGLMFTTLSASFVPATTARGRARRRGRVTVAVRVVNQGLQAIRPDVRRIAIHPGGTTVHPDRVAVAAAGVLSRPLGSGDAVEATLNFETAGAATAASRRSSQVKVFIDSGSFVVKLT